MWKRKRLKNNRFHIPVLNIKFALNALGVYSTSRTSICYIYCKYKGTLLLINTSNYLMVKMTSAHAETPKSFQSHVTSKLKKVLSLRFLPHVLQYYFISSCCQLKRKIVSLMLNYARVHITQLSPKIYFSETKAERYFWHFDALLFVTTPVTITTTLRWFAGITLRIESLEFSNC